ncbi:hypothetical protein EC9_27010 [Rosistilla ulvae]|uniref:Uncharacterized protein n=1 Tax=Rosistilla ulvae TaxID=1930277 RepID=A0A517M0V1_9BACT|nr:hypothetical protein [Rosistilla ulvae]QDS88510.1 hypothetical protein EC9_27010 [Rosistilla ulvae]
MPRTSLSLATVLIVGMSASLVQAQMFKNAISGSTQQLKRTGGNVSNYAKQRYAPLPRESYSKLGGPGGLVPDSRSSQQKKSQGLQYDNSRTVKRGNSNTITAGEHVKRKSSYAATLTQPKAQNQPQARQPSDAEAIAGAIGGLIGGFARAEQQRQASMQQQQRQQPWGQQRPQQQQQGFTNGSNGYGQVQRQGYSQRQNQGQMSHNGQSTQRYQVQRPNYSNQQNYSGQRSYSNQPTYSGQQNRSSQQPNRYYRSR